MRLALALIAAGLGAGALGGVWLHGRHHGVLACEARHEAARQRAQRDLHSAAEALSARALALARAEDARRRQALEAEDETRRNPDPCRLPDPDSLRRLARRWAAP